MFCVYGRSRQAASKYIDKKLLNQNSDISKELKVVVTQDEKQIILDKHIDSYFEIMPIRKCSHELSTPELAVELLRLMNAEVSFSDLEIMKKTPKLLKSGKESISKATGKKLMSWITLTD